MTDETLQLLRGSVDKRVRITCTDGEVLVAQIHFVSEEDEDVVCDLISTSNESRYEKHDIKPAYCVAFADILKAEPA